MRLEWWMYEADFVLKFFMIIWNKTGRYILSEMITKVLNVYIKFIQNIDVTLLEKSMKDRTLGAFQYSLSICMLNIHSKSL